MEACEAGAETPSAQPDTLLARCYLYRLFQLTFGQAPDKDLLGEVFSGRAKDCLDTCGATGSDASRNAVLRLAEEAREWKDDPAGYLERARDSYTHLFLGPGTPAAPPWESLHVPGEGVIFGKTTLAVRRAYAAEGFLPTGRPHVADDHIAIELDFLAKSAESQRETACNGDTSAEHAAARCQLEFLREHLAAWVGAFADSVEAADAAGPYAALARGLEAFVRRDAVFLEEGGCLK